MMRGPPFGRLRQRPTLLVSLGAIQDNFLELQRRSRSECAAVVKGNAYGHGLEACTAALSAVGASSFFVARYEDALIVRTHAPTAAIGVLNGLEGVPTSEFLRHRISPVLNSLRDVALWSGVAPDPSASFYVHLDTGMNRLGVSEAEQGPLRTLMQSLGSRNQGYISHFTSADDGDVEACDKQLSRFLKAVSAFPEAPLSIANSAGIALGRGLSLGFTRPGKSIFGIRPRIDGGLQLRTTARLIAPVLQLRTVRAKETAGYSGVWKASRKSTLATIGIGYANGLLRSISDRGVVYFSGRTAPIVGRISMDLAIVDVTDLEEPRPSEGDWVDLLGDDGFATLASAGDTIENEVAVALGTGCAKVYA